MQIITAAAAAAAAEAEMRVTVGSKVDGRGEREGAWQLLIELI